MSLVDTTIVGLTTTSASSATVLQQIAALGPATTLYESAIYMTYFLAIATTNLISPALARQNWKQLRKSTSHLMGLAVLFGTLVTIVCFAAGKPLIASMVGTSTSHASIIVPLATNYAWIRAAVAPFCVVDFVAQSFCLAILDTKTPAIAVVVASLINLVGDLLLSPKWGIQGAAVATAMATVSSSMILVRQVRKRTQEWKELQQTAEQERNAMTEKETTKTTTATTTTTTATTDSESTSASLENRTSLPTIVVDGSIELVGEQPSQPEKQNLSKKQNAQASVNKKEEDDIPFWSLPDRKSLLELFSLAGPIFFVMMGKTVCYSILTIRATQFGIVPLAAHNIMMRVFFFFSCFGDSLSQATQTFIPQVHWKGRGKLLKRLFVLSTGVGLFISLSSHFILGKLGRFLTKDAAIVQQMAAYAPYVGGAIVLHPFIMLLEGAILAKRDLMFLVGMYLCTMIVHLRMVLSTKSFQGLWQVFVFFQAFRLCQFAGRFVQEQRRQRREPMDATLSSSL